MAALRQPALAGLWQRRALVLVAAPEGCMPPPGPGAQVPIRHLCQNSTWWTLVKRLGGVRAPAQTQAYISLALSGLEHWVRFWPQMYQLDRGSCSLPRLMLGLQSSTALYFSCCNKVNVGFKINLCLVFILAFIFVSSFSSSGIHNRL